MWWWWLAFGDDLLLALDWLFEGYNTCFFGDSLTDDDDILYDTQINDPKMKTMMSKQISNCGEFFTKIRKDKRKKTASDFSCCATRKIFFSGFCFAFAICFQLCQFSLSAHTTYFSNYQHRLDELLHKFFLGFSPPNQFARRTIEIFIFTFFGLIDFRNFYVFPDIFNESWRLWRSLMIKICVGNDETRNFQRLHNVILIEKDFN